MQPKEPKPKKWFATQGGGVAVENACGILVWFSPPAQFSEMEHGGEVPAEWDTQGPFDVLGKRLETYSCQDIWD